MGTTVATNALLERAGAHKGGDGLIRGLTFHDQVDISLLSTRRHTQPFGLEGGDEGAHGVNYLRHGDGLPRPLDGCATATLKPGDTIILETPGRGGFGKKA